MNPSTSYHDWIKLLIHSGYGNLKILEKTLMQYPEYNDAACTLLKFSNEEDLEENPRGALDADFDASLIGKSRRVFVIEGLSRDLVGKAGSAFDIEPEFFAGHLRASNWEHYDGRCNAMMLPSIRKQASFWTLEYWECIQMTGPYRLGRARLETTQPLFRRMFVRSPCGHGVQRCTVALVNRFVSMWERRSEGGCYDAVVLVDTPLPKDLKFQYDDVNSREDHRAYWVPYGDGPLSFANLEARRRFLDNYPVDLEDRPGSVKDSLLWRLKSPTHCSFPLVAHIIVLRRDFESVSLDNLTNDQVRTADVKGALKDLGSCRNLFERCSVIMRRNIGHLKMSPEATKFSIDHASTMPELLLLDWKFISSEIEHCIKETDQFINIRLASLSVLDSKRSREDSERASRDSERSVQLSESSNQLIKLGQLLILVFTPASFAHGLFSMGGDFLPGNKRFWVFFAVAVPLSIITQLMFFIWTRTTSRNSDRRVSTLKYE
ncbi:hypothetical protein CC78DRAFT_614590 [Lojkania enalia]|uniref:Uncharacterized protein n=1 Tax=Lojkania enalia TaxID=147567 RepID=A0A9P4KCK8_9PLEO|nr:hypothetical protein CC78DRAFT_614590 [Didymosphaeria enalia]